jgi:hypothetical protein
MDARKTFLLKALLSSRSGDDCCVIRPLVRGLWLALAFVRVFICVSVYSSPKMKMAQLFLVVVILTVASASDSNMNGAITRSISKINVADKKPERPVEERKA